VFFVRLRAQKTRHPVLLKRHGKRFFWVNFARQKKPRSCYLEDAIEIMIMKGKPQWNNPGN